MKKVLLFLLGILFATNSFANDIAANVTNPVCDNATLEKYNGTANVEIDWVPNTIALRWYNGEQQLSVPTESQSCVYDGAMVIPSAPTRTGYTFMGWTVIDVPNGYTKLEYLESTNGGGQYIDTGIVPSLNYSIEVKAIKGLNYSLFGSSALYNLTGYNTSNYFYLGHYGNYYGRTFFPSTIDNSLVHVWGFNSNTKQIYCDDIVITTNMGTIEPVYNLWLFARSDPNSAGLDAGPSKIYYAKLWDDSNQLVFNGIPARRDSDGVLGMYDTVSGQFFTNAGTGEFIAGPVVLPSGYTRLEYIESRGYQYINTRITVDDGDVLASATFMPTSFSLIDSSQYATIFGRNANFQAAYDGDGCAWIGNSANAGFFSLNTKYIVSGILSANTANIYYVNGVSTGLSRNFRASLPIYLFASEAAADTEYSYGSIGRMYDFTAIRNNVEIMHLIPARRNNDGVLGMYDTVSQTFFTNSGTGTFIAGPVAQ